MINNNNFYMYQCTLSLSLSLSLFLPSLSLTFPLIDSEKKDIGTTAGITISAHSSTDRNNTTEDTVYSRMAKTHGFRKLRTPSRCKGCDTYVYFHGFECETVSYK